MHPRGGARVPHRGVRGPGVRSQGVRHGPHVVRAAGELPPGGGENRRGARAGLHRNSFLQRHDIDPAAVPRGVGHRGTRIRHRKARRDVRRRRVHRHLRHGAAGGHAAQLRLVPVHADQLGSDHDGGWRAQGCRLHRARFRLTGRGGPECDSRGGYSDEHGGWGWVLVRDVQREAGQASVEVEEQRFGPAFGGVREVGLLAV